MNWKNCLVYIDDVLIWSKNFAKHLRELKQIFLAFVNAGLWIKNRKCYICCTEVLNLGHLCSFEKIQMDPKRVRAIAEMPPPSKRQTVQSFVSLVNYNKCMLLSLSKIKAPLWELVTNTQFIWSDSAQRFAFDSNKREIAVNTVLAYFDPKATFIFDTNASDIALGVVLSQIGLDHDERTIAFALRVFSVS